MTASLLLKRSVTYHFIYKAAVSFTCMQPLIHAGLGPPHAPSSDANHACSYRSWTAFAQAIAHSCQPTLLNSLTHHCMKATAWERALQSHPDSAFREYLLYTVWDDKGFRNGLNCRQLLSSA